MILPRGANRLATGLMLISYHPRSSVIPPPPQIFGIFGIFDARPIRRSIVITVLPRHAPCSYAHMAWQSATPA